MLIYLEIRLPVLLAFVAAVLAIAGTAQGDPRPLAGEGRDLDLRVAVDRPHAVEIAAGGRVLVQSPEDGLWSVATRFENGWPAAWVHARPSRKEVVGRWTIVHGTMKTESGNLEVRDAYCVEGDRIHGIRRFTWRGKEPLEKCALAIRWAVPGAGEASPLLPGISYCGNPSGARHPDRVPLHSGLPGSPSLYEEHRYPMPFAAIEWERGGAFFGAALHTLPSQPRGGRHADQWWSLGLETTETGMELLALSGPCATNGRKNVVKAQQGKLMEYPAPWVTLRPGMVMEKTFHLQVCPLERAGTGFDGPVAAAIDLHRPFDLAGLPGYGEILEEKLRFARSRFRDFSGRPGFEMYPEHVKGTHYVMGWCGQAASVPYAYLVLADRFSDPALRGQAARCLDLLSGAPFNKNGFLVRYDADTDRWSGQDPVSQGQAMENFALAIEAGRSIETIDTSKWEIFLEKACRSHAARILEDGWRPVSTNEAFLVSPLLRGARLFGSDLFREAACKAVDHYAARHLPMAEPYWGGTLDASCEDKEGAWAAFQAFLAAYDDSGERRHLGWAEHAMNVFLTYVVVWDMEMPAGRLRDFAFRTRGWTSVSPQNEHLDVYGVVATPALYRMGCLLGRADLKRLAAVMYRSCGQLIDPYGSQGEQIQQTTYAQHGDMSDVFRLRGDYSEGWTVFWITAHFLNAAASFEKMGVDLDDTAAAGGEAPARSRVTAPAPLYRDPVYDGAADPVIVWNRGRAAWWMLYTQRRAKLDLPGVAWCHGTQVGIAESRDLGNTWRYVGTVPLQPLDDEEYSFWAPDVVEHDGVYHLFVSYVPGKHADWAGDRYILHYASRDLDEWAYRGRIDLASDRCIDPTLYRFPDGKWRMWYKDEGRGSRTLAVESMDLDHWTVVADPGVSERYGEAPKVFRFDGSYWMLKDPNSGLDLYRSSDLAKWEYQGKILEKPGRRNDDGSIGKHADVVVSGGRAFIIYFTHPAGQDYALRDGVMRYPARRSSIQAAELVLEGGKLTCDRDAPCRIRLEPPGCL